jgi:heme-degrading monooxygenase HmoA
MERHIMPQLTEMDEKVTLVSQEVEQLLHAWAADAAFMKRQPGFISTQLHRGIGGSCVFINYAVWESVEVFKDAFFRPEFQEAIQKYLPSAVGSPHLVQKVAVPAVCVA